MLPEWLTRITPEQAAQFILNDRYWEQPKCDGDRLMVDRSGDELRGWNKLGNTTSVESQLRSVLRSLTVQSFILDGEIEPDGYHVWDLLRVNQEDLTTYAYADRYSILEHFGSFPLIHVVPSWRTSAVKEHMLFECLRSGVEGIVFKDSRAIYRPGRSGQHFKLKFEKTATVRIKNIDPSRDRADIEMLDGDQWIEVSGLKIDKAKIRVGDYVEVRYRSATRSQHIVEPVFLHVRRDVRDEDCSTDQLDYGGRWAYLKRNSRMCCQVNGLET